MEKLYKSSALDMTGLQKAAILLCEIGPFDNDNYSALEKALHLTTDEMKKLRKTMQSLKPYLQPVPENIEEIQREEAVLNEVIEFGKQRGIFHQLAKSELKNVMKKNDKASQVSDLVKENPDSVAKLISTWLTSDEDKK